MVERFTITAAEQDPWVDVDANGQWVRYADYAAEREQWINYTTDLQRIIEALCGNRKLPQPVSSARHHYNMAERALAERAGGVNEDALRALAQAYDREDAAQRGEPDPWNLDDPGDIGDSDTWVSERLACARAAAEAFLSALSRTGAVKVELSGNSGELIDRMAEAIRDWGSHYDDGPWETLPEDRKAGWRGDAERALAVVKEYLMARALSSPDHIADAGKVEGDGWKPGCDRLPTLQEAAFAAKVLNACNGYDLSVWTDDLWPCDDASEGIRAIIAHSALLSAPSGGDRHGE